MQPLILRARYSTRNFQYGFLAFQSSRVAATVLWSRSQTRLTLAGCFFWDGGGGGSLGWWVQSVVRGCHRVLTVKGTGTLFIEVPFRGLAGLPPWPQLGGGGLGFLQPHGQRTKPAGNSPPCSRRQMEVVLCTASGGLPRAKRGLNDHERWFCRIVLGSPPRFGCSWQNPKHCWEWDLLRERGVLLVEVVPPQPCSHISHQVLRIRKNKSTNFTLL